MSRWDFIELLYLERTEGEKQREGEGEYYWRGAPLLRFISPLYNTASEFSLYTQSESLHVRGISPSFPPLMLPLFLIMASTF